MLGCDVIVISDTSMIANDTPSLTTGLRGLAYMEVFLTGPNRDLHSGTFGGAVANPINTLCEMIAKLKDENGRITIPGFYDDVVELSAAEREKMAQRPFDYAQYCAELDIAETRGEKGYAVIEQVSIRPTLDVNGIWGGYTLAKARKPSSLARPRPRFRCGWCPISIPTRSCSCFSNILKVLRPKASRSKSGRTTAVSRW
jgi:hypothetical protein